MESVASSSVQVDDDIQRSAIATFNGQHSTASSVQVDDNIQRSSESASMSSHDSGTITRLDEGLLQVQEKLDALNREKLEKADRKAREKESKALQLLKQKEELIALEKLKLALAEREQKATAASNKALGFNVGKAIAELDSKATVVAPPAPRGKQITDSVDGSVSAYSEDFDKDSVADSSQVNDVRSEVDDFPDDVNMDDGIEDNIEDDTEAAAPLTEKASLVQSVGSQAEDETYGQDHFEDDASDDDYAEDTFTELSQSPRQQDVASPRSSSHVPKNLNASVTFNESRATSSNESSLNISRAGLSLDASSFAELNNLEQSVADRQEHVVDLNAQLAKKRREFQRLQKMRAKVEERSRIQEEERELQKQVEEMERLIAHEKDQIAAIINGPPIVDEENLPGCYCQISVLDVGCTCKVVYPEHFHDILRCFIFTAFRWRRKSYG